MEKFLQLLASAQHGFVNFSRLSIFIVMVWIGGLKVFPYEAEGIIPFVANSPVMSFLLNKPAPEYKQHKNMEGQLVPENVAWHKANGTYIFSYALGTVIVMIGALTLAGIWNEKLGLLGGLFTFIMSLVTLSFLITTPQVYVPALGGPHHGFPYLSGAGRLVIKDVIMMTAGLIVASDAAKRILKNQK
ncbi:reactive chlorine resistance membrane protein RclC [Pedobacter heparinus]|uniref:reactive chlorine resistance membrane protein RclC n=1 Tax=Pedobacter heparinus TaxID=984 RepID=UPI0029303FAE|nr:reactive chlorine resistance membrane protein RclC [Pedobacter heparinus]